MIVLGRYIDFFSSLYDISIVADGIISFPKNSSSLFGFYQYIACGPAGIYNKS